MSPPNALIGQLEDRGFLVFVDSDNARGMLDRAGDAADNVKLRDNEPAGLADLPVIRRAAGIDHSAAGADGAGFGANRVRSVCASSWFPSTSAKDRAPAGSPLPGWQTSRNSLSHGLCRQPSAGSYPRRRSERLHVPCCHTLSRRRAWRQTCSRTSR